MDLFKAIFASSSEDNEDDDEAEEEKVKGLPEQSQDGKRQVPQPKYT